MAELDVIDSANPEASVGLLSRLPRGHGELPAYYRKLLDSEDEVLRVGAMCALIDGNALPADVLKTTAIPLCRYGAVRTRVFGLLMEQGQTLLARDVLAVPFDEADTFAEERLRLRLAGDDTALAALEGRQFLRDGSLEHLRNAMSHAEAAGGWRAALPWTVRAMLVMPVDGGLAFTLLQLLSDANQLGLLKTAFQIFEQANVFPTTRVIFDATLQLRAGQAERALRILNDLRQPAPIANVQAFIEQQRARAWEALGDYRQAYGFYAKMNEARQKRPPDPDVYCRHIRGSAAFRFGSLKKDPRTNHFIMLGFARSGTTLLENVLGSHPEVEALEEKNSLTLAVRFLESQSDGVSDHAPGLAARRMYYDHLDRFRLRPEARILVDKNPMYSAYAGLLQNLFPDKRHIFVIRDPRDVIMSCFKQIFTTNLATENFLSFATTCRIYDFVMSHWFKHFTLEDERVCYTRYDDIVVDFDREIRRILEFLGTDWDPAVQSFAKVADEREARTPSYQKVRQGLQIGVQSQWRNYRFLFEGAKRIDKWVDFFGYEAT